MTNKTIVTALKNMLVEDGNSTASVVLPIKL